MAPGWGNPEYKKSWNGTNLLNRVEEKGFIFFVLASIAIALTTTLPESYCIDKPRISILGLPNSSGKKAVRNDLVVRGAQGYF